MALHLENHMMASLIRLLRGQHKDTFFCLENMFSHNGCTIALMLRLYLPTEGYLVGRVPPPHLSPFVDNEAEGYIPEYAETIKRLQAAVKKQELPMPGLENQDLDDPQTLLVEGIIDRTDANEAAEKN
ncbi:unnamed protein product [Musa textilis]